VTPAAVAAAPTFMVLLGAVLSVAGAVVAIARFRLHPFPVLLLAALSTGLFAGLPAEKIVGAVNTGFGSVMAGVGAPIGLGAILGGMAAGSGGAHALANRLSTIARPGAVVWILAALAMLVGAPLFFETGVVILMPVVLALGARMEALHRGRSGYVLAAVPALAGLAAMHGLVPPHPGPLIALAALDAPLGRTFLLGTLAAVPAVVLAGPLFAPLAARIARAEPPAAFREEQPAGARAPGAGTTLATLLAPVLLITARAVADLALPPGDGVRVVLDFLGAPTVALLIAVALAYLTLGVLQGADRRTLQARLASGLPPVGSILLIIGAGGAFKQVLVDSQLGAALGQASGAAHLPPLLLGWLTAALVRVATGSSTVATITASGILAQAVHAGLAADPALMVLAIGAGSLFLSHINDAGFWLVREYLGMSVPDTFKTWSAVATLLSLLALAAVLALGAVL
jgi:GntP family gluconate:H+ symporter